MSDTQTIDFPGVLRFGGENTGHLGEFPRKNTCVAEKIGANSIHAKSHHQKANRGEIKMEFAIFTLCVAAGLTIGRALFRTR